MSKPTPTELATFARALGMKIPAASVDGKASDLKWAKFFGDAVHEWTRWNKEIEETIEIQAIFEAPKKTADGRFVSVDHLRNMLRAREATLRGYWESIRTPYPGEEPDEGAQEWERFKRDGLTAKEAMAICDERKRRMHERAVKGALARHSPKSVKKL